MTRTYLAAVIVFLAISPGVALDGRAQDSLQDLHGADDLKAAFNRDDGSYRLILLVSPT